MSKTTLPDLPVTPSSPMFIDDVMTIEWQEFFRDIFDRIGGYEAKTNLELDESISQAKQIPAMLLDYSPEESDAMSYPLRGEKGEKGDRGQMGPPGMDGEGDTEIFAGFAAGDKNQINGDGTLNNVLRKTALNIKDGTNANTINCQLTSSLTWNGDNDGPTDNIAKGGTTGNYNLNAGGNSLYIDADALTGNCVEVIVAKVFNNASNANIAIKELASINGIQLIFTDGLLGTDLDLTSLVDTGDIYLHITYLTDA